VTEHTVLIKNADVVLVDKDCRGWSEVLRNASVVIEGDKIAAIGPSSKIAKDYTSFDTTIDGERKVVLPGFVNAHAHVAGSFLRGLLEDIPNHFYGYALPLEKFLTPDSIRTFSLLGAIEALRFGVTCINDHYYHSDQVARAFAASGIRGVVAETVLDVDMAKLKDGRYKHNLDAGMKALETGARLVRDWSGRGDGRISCRIGVHATDTCSKELLLASNEAAQKLGVGIHMHLAQTAKEVNYVRRTYGKGAVEYLGEIGLLSDKIVAAHLNYAKESELALLSNHKVGAVQCPTIYGKMCVKSKLDWFGEQGVPCGLGTDWLSMDIWDNMRSAIGISRTLTGREVFTAQKILEFATIGSARVLGMDSSIGSIEPGKKADLVVINTKSAHMSPLRNPIQTAVYYASAGDVDYVFVNGELVVDSGKTTQVSEEDVVRQAQALAEEIWGKLPYPVDKFIV
jgi:5-methylthioadenosine/S-adenosylhomocysteine deaminase